MFNASCADFENICFICGSTACAEYAFNFFDMLFHVHLLNVVNVVTQLVLNLPFLSHSFLKIIITKKQQFLFFIMYKIKKKI